MGTVYGLLDPREPGRVRYVGKTTGGVEARRRRHMRESADATHRATWIRSLLRDGVEPGAVVLEVTDGDLGKAECRWIAALAGNDLVNGTDGGTGGSTRSAPPWNKGRQVGPHTAERRAAISASRRGQKLGPMSAQHREAIGRAHRGRRHTAEHVANQAESLRRSLAGRP